MFTDETYIAIALQHVLLDATAFGGAPPQFFLAVEFFEHDTQASKVVEGLQLDPGFAARYVSISVLCACLYFLCKRVEVLFVLDSVRVLVRSINLGPCLVRFIVRMDAALVRYLETQFVKVDLYEVHGLQYTLRASAYVVLNDMCVIFLLLTVSTADAWLFASCWTYRPRHKRSCS